MTDEKIDIHRRPEKGDTVIWVERENVTGCYIISDKWMEALLEVKPDAVVEEKACSPRSNLP